MKACDTVQEKIEFDEKKQKSKFSDRCSLEQSRGPCGNYTLKWYFDSQTSMCNMFWYGSCGGNDNRFDSEEECENNCLKDNSEGKNLFLFYIYFRISILFFFSRCNIHYKLY